MQSDYDVCGEFYESTCGCKKTDGKLCSPLKILLTCANLVLLGLLMTTLHDHDTTVAHGKHQLPKEQR